MMIRDLLGQGRKQLNKWDGSSSVDLDSSLLLCFVLHLERSQLFARLTDPVSSENAAEFHKLIEKRCQNYPVAYLTGGKEFFGRYFKVCQGILCPRPDTEIIIETAVELLSHAPSQNLLDLCSGSGCIGLTMALERTDSFVVCADIDRIPEQIFKENSINLKAGNARFIRSDLFENISHTFNMILTNPPYLTTIETTERMDEGWKEPPLALDGGDDGLDLIRKIIAKSIDYLECEGYLLIEAASNQMEAIGKMLADSGFSHITLTRDLAGQERVIYGQWH